MPVFARLTGRLAVIGAVAAIALTCGIASAQAPGGLQITMSVDGGDPINVDPGGISLGGGLFHYEGSLLSTGQWNLSWNLNADTDPFINGNIAVANFGAATQVFDLVVSVPVLPTGPGLVMGGSAALGLTANPGGGTVTPVAGIPGWAALINGAVVQTMYATPASGLTLGGLGSTGSSQTFGTPIPSAPGPIGITATSIGIHLHFSLTPGDQFSMTSVFVIIPGPGALALLSIGMMFGRRRRMSV